MNTLATVGITTLIYRDRFAYCAHPSITALDNGEWLVAFRFMQRWEGKIMHSHPQDHVFLTRTSDKGETWDEPCYAPDFDWHGGQCPGISQLSNGTVALLLSRENWYPLAVAKKRRAEGEPISIWLPGQRYVQDFKDDDWDRAVLTWARGYSNLYVYLSTDRGHTFEDTVKIDTSPYFCGQSRTGVVQLQDGRVAGFVSVNAPAPQATYILFSSTGGKSWDPPILITEHHIDFAEADIAEVAPGELYCILREEGGYLYGCRSQDGGHSWSVPEVTPLFGKPGHLLVLRDGRLLCTYGRRIAPFGIRACLSKDGGRTWEIDQEIVIRNDLPNSDLGYPVTIEYAPGQLFTCYYGQELDGVTCILGNHVTLT